MFFRLGAAVVLLALVLPLSATSPVRADSVDQPRSSATSVKAAVGGHRHYDEGTRRVAREIDCTNIFIHGSLVGLHEAAKCDIRGERVDLITFKSAAQQRRFIRNVDPGGRNTWWASGKGAIVIPVSTYDDREPAEAAARRLPGDLRRG